MSDQKGKNALRPRGSLLLEILAVLLAAALIFTLTYPKKVWKQEELNTEKCHENMWHIYFAEVTYLDSELAYNDTLEKVINFILSDTTEKLLRRYTSIDSVLGMDIVYSFKELADTISITVPTEFDSLYEALPAIDSTSFFGHPCKVDSVSGEPPDSMFILKVQVPVVVLIDSMLSFANAVDLDTTEAFILDSLRTWPEYSERIDSIALATMNQIYNCPTTGKPYIIEANNDTLPKLVNIYCPLDSTDQEALKKDFKLYFLGGLRIENHGGIESGEKTW